MSAIFPKLEGLDSLARRDGVDIRPTLVRVLTDLYVEARAQFRRRAPLHRAGARLIDSVDLGTRVTSPRNSAPMRARRPRSRGGLRAM